MLTSRDNARQENKVLYQTTLTIDENTIPLAHLSSNKPFKVIQNGYSFENLPG
jgi:hypothetical protein